MQEYLREYLAAHGYCVLFIWAFLEGEAGLMLAGFLAFHGYFTIPVVIITASSGAPAFFYLGRQKGKYLLSQSHLLARKLRKGLRLIERYGRLVAFTSRYTYDFRICTANNPWHDPFFRP